MGAVKTNRRELLNPYYRKGAIYFRKSLLEKADKDIERSLQSLGVDGEPYRKVNNRRKMAGLPMIRRAKS